MLAAQASDQFVMNSEEGDLDACAEAIRPWQNLFFVCKPWNGSARDVEGSLHAWRPSTNNEDNLSSRQWPKLSMEMLCVWIVCEGKYEDAEQVKPQPKSHASQRKVCAAWIG